MASMLARFRYKRPVTAWAVQLSRCKSEAMVNAHKSLVVHGGHGKAGSSAIQNFLYTNRDLLCQSGILVLDLPLTSVAVGSSGFSSTEDFYSCLLSRPDEFAERFVACFSCDNPVFAGFHTVIWSNESLITFYELLAPALQFLAGSWDVRLLLIFRNQVEWIASAYNQWVIVDGPSNDEPITFAQHVMRELSQDSKNTKYKEIIDGWSSRAPSVRVDALAYPIEKDVCKLFAETYLSGYQGLAYNELNVNDTISLSKLFLIKHLRETFAKQSEGTASTLKHLIALVINAQPMQGRPQVLSIYGQCEYDFSMLEKWFEADNELLETLYGLTIPSSRKSKLQHFVKSDELLGLCLEIIASLSLCFGNGIMADRINNNV